MAYRDYFTKGTKQHKIKNLLLIVSAFIFLYLVQAYISTPFMFVDFPCFVQVRETYLVEDNNFVRSIRLTSRNLDVIGDIKHALLFISEYPPHSSGGGCLQKSLSNNESIELDNHKIKIVDDKLIVDGNTVESGNEWKKTELALEKFNPLNPWWLYLRNTALKNEGFVLVYKGDHEPHSIKDFDKNVLAITGYNSVCEFINPLTLIIFLLSVITIIVLTLSSVAYYIKNKFFSKKAKA